MSAHSEDELRIIGKVQKLLELADKNPNQHEADAARAKAQQLMTEYNLTQGAIEQASGAINGRRETLRTEGGFYQWQRALYKAVAELNFCLYWTAKSWVPATYPNARPGQLMRKREHKLIGRTVNTSAAAVMAQYLEKAIERAVDEALAGSDQSRHSAYAHSFRQGAADALVYRIGQRFREQLRAEAVASSVASQAAANVKTTGISSSTALTLTSYKQSEEDANLDHKFGEGYSARKRAREAKEAEDRRKAEQEYTKWAAANPKEARALEEKWERRWDRQYRSEERAEARKWAKRDYGGYKRGQEAGREISIDQQVDTTRAKGLLT